MIPILVAAGTLIVRYGPAAVAAVLTVRETLQHAKDLKGKHIITGPGYGSSDLGSALASAGLGVITEKNVFDHELKAPPEVFASYAPFHEKYQEYKAYAKGADAIMRRFRKEGGVTVGYREAPDAGDTHNMLFAPTSLDLVEREGRKLHEPDWLQSREFWSVVRRLKQWDRRLDKLEVQPAKEG
jgi:hypothetical protein